MIVHVCISGFTQGYGTWHGIINLAEKLTEGYSDSVDKRVLYFPWKACWCDVAEYLFALHGRYDEPLRIAVAAYSWGAGFGAVRLAEALQRRSLDIEALVLSDPVYCHPLLTLRWRAMTYRDWPGLPAPRIRFPANVREGWSFYQTINRPRAHRLEFDPSTIVHEPVQVWAGHQWMDDIAPFHNQVLEVARRMSCPTL